jgi:hypothetical protein
MLSFLCEPSYNKASFTACAQCCYLSGMLKITSFAAKEMVFGAEKIESRLKPTS